MRTPTHHQKALAQIGEAERISRQISQAMEELTPSMLSINDLFKGRHFDREIIILCVRWYLRFKLRFPGSRGNDGRAQISWLTLALDTRAMFRSSKSGGTASHAEPAPLGASMKPT